MSPAESVLLWAMGVGFGVVLGTLGWMARKILVHDSALAVLITEVNPAGKPSLRDLLQAQAIQIARIAEHSTPTVTVNTNGATS